MVRALGTQMWNADFVETGFTGRTDFVVLRYLVTNNGPSSNNLFRFQSNVVKVDRILG
jgi:hypothetical protein